jgi:pimeloyl-[acyl-carrier protein] methyl ester esterase
MHRLTGATALATLLLAAIPATAQPTPPRLFEHSRLVTDDRISVEVIGRGPDLMLISGLASSRETWRATAERLRGRYRLHLIQLAGFAGEPARANATGPVLATTAEAIDAYINAKHIAPATVIGHSLGGTMILWLAEHHPEHLKRALIVDALPWVSQVFISPNVTMAEATRVAERIRTGPPQPEAAQAKMIDAMVGGDAERAMVLGWTNASDPRVVANALADDMELDLRPGLGAVRPPITLLYPDYAPAGVPVGATDHSYGAAYTAAPTVKLKRVDHSLHFIMLDQPAAFAADLDAFLAG